MEAEKDYKIVPFGQGRFAIADESGKIVDDAQGYGYKTRQKAFLAKNWKFSGGKAKAGLRKKQFRDWLKENPDHQKIVNDFNQQVEWGFKEIAYGEITIAEIWKQIGQKYDIEIPDYVKKEC